MGLHRAEGHPEDSMHPDEHTIRAFLAQLAQGGAALCWAGETRTSALTPTEVDEAVARFSGRAQEEATAWVIGCREGISDDAKRAAVHAVCALTLMGSAAATRVLVERTPIALGHWPKDSAHVARCVAAGCIVEWR